MRSSKLGGAHVRFGQSDKREGFADSTRFYAPLLLANVGEAPVTAHVSLDYTVQGPKQEERRSEDKQKRAGGPEPTTDKVSTVVVKHVTIRSGDVQLIELSRELSTLSGPVKEAGVDIAYDGPPGTLIGQLTNVDESGDYSFEVPIKDPSARDMSMEGGYPWTIEDGKNTTVYLKNTTNKPVRAFVVVGFPDGSFYHPPLVELQPYQTLAIDLRKLKESGAADARGNGFRGTHGQVVWRQVTPYSIVGRAETVSLKDGIASSFTCGTGCCEDFSQSSGISTTSIAGPVGTTTDDPVIGWASGVDCYAWPFWSPEVTAASGQTGNSGIAYGSSSYAVLVGVGSTWINFGIGNPTYYYDEYEEECKDSTWQNNWEPVGVLSFTAIQHSYPNNPLAYTCRITAFFDAYRNAKAHKAQDVVKNGGGTSHGDAVKAMEAGTVVAIASGHGPAAQAYPQCAGTGAPVNYVKIRTGDGYDTIYAHVSPSVSVNQQVTAGQQIGTLDNSGCQSAPHLHVGRKNSSGTPVNFTLPCVNPTPITNFDDGDVLDDVSDSL